MANCLLPTAYCLLLQDTIRHTQQSDNGWQQRYEFSAGDGFEQQGPDRDQEEDDAQHAGLPVAKQPGLHERASLLQRLMVR